MFCRKVWDNLKMISELGMVWTNKFIYKYFWVVGSTELRAIGKPNHWAKGNLLFAAVLGKSYNSYMHIGNTKDPTIYCFMGSKLRNRIPEDLLNCSPFMACRFYRLLGFWTTPAASNQQKYTYMYVLENCTFRKYL